MPTTVNQSAEDPASSDPQALPTSSEDNPQSAGESLQPLQPIPAVDPTQNATLESESSQLEALTHDQGLEVPETTEQEALTHIQSSEVPETTEQEALTHIQGSEVPETAQNEALTHIQSSEVPETTEQEALTHIQGSETTEQEALTHIQSSEVPETTEQEALTHIQSSEVPETTEQEALTHIHGSEAPDTAEQLQSSEVATNAEDLIPPEKCDDILTATEAAMMSEESPATFSDNGPEDTPAPVQSKGFQDAFAAFASASLPEPEEEDMETQRDTHVADSDTSQANMSENMESEYAEPSDTNPMSTPDVTDQPETLQSSELDPGMVSTSNDQVAGELAQESLPVGETFQHMLQNLQASGEAESQLYQATGENITKHDAQSLTQNQGAEGMDVQEQQMVEQPAAEGAIPDQMASTVEQQAAQEAAAVSDSVYFIQGTDVNGEVVTSIIDPNDIGSYLDSVVYKQCMMPNGEIETTIVHSGVQPTAQEQQPQQQQEEQVIYAHDLNGQLTPIDSAQSANDVAPPGKQFVYMQDSTGRIIRTIMDANQTMVPGQQVYYTQSDDGRIITSVMDPTSSGGAVEDQQPQEDQMVYQQQQQDAMLDNTTTAGLPQQQPETVGETANFNLDSGLSGLDMLAELSHLTAGQTPTASGLPSEHKGTSSTDSNSADMDEFRPVAMVTRRIGGDEGMDEVSSTMSGLNVGQLESPIYKLISELKPELQTPSLSVSRDNLFVQWQNLDAMCWMDVVLIMLVYSPTLRPLVNLDPGHELASTLLITLLKANRQAQVLVQNLLKKSNGAEVTGLQTGAGNAATSIQDPKTAKLVCKENMDEIGKAINILYAMREKIWQALQPRLRCERGKHNSPVLVLPLLVREKPAIKQMFTMNYRYVFRCEKCGYTQDDVHTKILPSIPAVPNDFNMREPCFVRNCFECQAPNQRMLMKFEGLQDFVQMHFVKGLPHNRFDELSFDFQGDHYEVTAVVHYKNNPDHFIAWVRNAPGSTWMECDDLRSVITRYHHTMPAIPPSQVHMVMWERRLTPAHQLLMRDTEDTKVLSSLVLTVQQPSTHQTSDPAARPTGLPSTSPSTPAAGKTSSLLTNMPTQPTQSSIFSPYVPRGRGRGGRGGRGSRGGRGASSISTTPTIRRTAPISLTGNTGVNSTGSPQIVRLPLSALSNSGVSLGSTPSTTKYVLMGNNSGGQGAGGTASKVVVVRSQGGANNLTAQQLLQLLQRTGAISQSGAKIAIASSGVNTTAAITSTVTTNVPATVASNASKGSTSYIIQPDGTILTTSAPVSTVAQPIQSSAQITNPESDAGAAGTSGDITNSALSNNVGESKPSVKLVSVLPSALASLTSAYGQGMSSTTVPQGAGTGQMLMDQSSSQVSEMDTSGEQQQGFANEEATETPPVPQTSEENSETLSTANIPQTSENDPLIVSPETTAPPALTSPPSAVAQQQQGAASRFIQIPTSGGGSILTQLVVRNGKMVLVPVDKNTQAQAQPSSVLKLSGGAVGSASKITLRTANTGASQILSSNLINSQPQQQQQMDTISSPSSLTSAVASAGLSNLMSKGSQSFITVPGAKGATPKRTIQLISVPRSGQQSAKTFILNAGSDPNAASSAAHQLSIPAEPANSTSGAADDQSLDQGRILSQEGNIVIRELRRPETSPATLTTTLMGDSGSSLVSTPAVSLLRDVSSRSSQAGTNVVGDGQKQHESFKYILPGSNTTHILHTGNSGSAGQVGSRAFTALSSSGTIIGGQLTPAPGSAIGTSPMDQDLGLSDPEDGGNLFGLGTPEYVPVSRGRARGGRGSRGGRSSRGGRRARGIRASGRGQASSELWSSMETVAPGSSGQSISALSGLRQVGAHVIESGAENIDGVPVLSIPEFSASQSEASSAVESIQGETQMVPDGAGILGQDQQQPLAAWTSPEAASINTSSNPMVITQSIPSVKANHGFDILTQGILGREAGGPPQTFKKARSLLTGAQVTTATPVFSGTLDQHANSNFSVPAMTSPDAQEMNLPDQSLAQTQHSEIDTLIEAAFAAAKPPMSNAAQTSATSESSHHMLSENKDTHGEPGKHDQRVVSVEERHVSTAEKYRMPVELFQPDDEPFDKLVKSEMWSTKILEAVEPDHQSGENVEEAHMEETHEQSVQPEEEQAEVENDMRAPTEGTDITGANDSLVSNSFPTPENDEISTGAESPSKSSRQTLDSEQDVMDIGSPVSLQPQQDNKDPLEAEQHAPTQVDHMMETSKTEQSQETITETRVEEKNVTAPTQKTPSKHRGRRKGHKRGRTGSRKGSNISTGSDTNSIHQDKKDEIQSKVVTAQDQNTIQSIHETEGDFEEKKQLQSNAEKLDQIETPTEITGAVEKSDILNPASQDEDFPVSQQNTTNQDALINVNIGSPSKGKKQTEVNLDSSSNIDTVLSPKGVGAIEDNPLEESERGENFGLSQSVHANQDQTTPEESNKPLEDTSEQEDVDMEQSLSVEEEESRQHASNLQQSGNKHSKRGRKDSLKGIPTTNSYDNENEKVFEAVLLKKRRPCVDWTKRMAKKEDCPFNYRVLLGGRLPKVKHPSVDFKALSQPLRKKSREVITEPLPAKVTRRQEKPGQQPERDTSKDSSLVPMVVERDEPCTGGSVITSPTDGETFISVIAGHKRQKADWACTDDGQEEACDEELPWDSFMSPEESRLAKAQYCHQLAMVLFMQAGDVSFLLANDENETDDELDDISVKSSSGAQDLKDDAVRLSEVTEETGDCEVEDKSTGVKDSNIEDVEQHEPAKLEVFSTQSNEPISTPDVACQPKPGRKRGRKKKHRGRSLPSPSPASPASFSETPPIKRQRLSQDEPEENVVEVGSTEAPVEVPHPEQSDPSMQVTDPLACPASEDHHSTPASPTLPVPSERKRGRPKKVSVLPICPDKTDQAALDIPPSKKLHESENKTVAKDDFLDNSNTEMDISTCHTNGIGSPPPPPPAGMDQDQKEESNAYQSPTFSPSSSRRSGRMTIPPRKVLD